MPRTPNPNSEPQPPTIYEIRIGGQLSQDWNSWFEALSIITEESGETLIVLPVADQAALFGLLKKVRDLGIPLVSVNPLEQGHSTTLGADQADQSNVK